MSEDRSRFSIKKGEIEITYEGKTEDVNNRYREAFAWVVKTGADEATSAHVSGRKKKTIGAGAEKSKPEKHAKGVAEVISKLMEESWFDKDRKNTEVLEELERQGVTGVYLEAVDSALKRRLKKKTLERHKSESGDWVYHRAKPATGG
jgi:ribosome maturation protein Sdo1